MVREVESYVGILAHVLDFARLGAGGDPDGHVVFGREGIHGTDLRASVGVLRDERAVSLSGNDFAGGGDEFGAGEGRLRFFVGFSGVCGMDQFRKVRDHEGG